MCRASPRRSSCPVLSSTTGIHFNHYPCVVCGSHLFHVLRAKSDEESDSSIFESKLRDIARSCPRNISRLRSIETSVKNQRLESGYHSTGRSLRYRCQCNTRDVDMSTCVCQQGRPCQIMKTSKVNSCIF